MQNAKKVNPAGSTYTQLRNVKNDRLSALRKVKAVESEHHSNFSLLKRFLKEIQSNNDNSLRMYNREVI